MFQAVGKEVLSLHRLAMGPLRLESDLAHGQRRALPARGKPGPVADDPSLQLTEVVVIIPVPLKLASST